MCLNSTKRKDDLADFHNWDCKKPVFAKSAVYADFHPNSISFVLYRLGLFVLLVPFPKEHDFLSRKPGTGHSSFRQHPIFQNTLSDSRK